MVSFLGLCNGKIMVRKINFFWVLCRDVLFFFSPKISTRVIKLKRN